eukprot:UN26502
MNMNNAIDITNRTRSEAESLLNAKLKKLEHNIHTLENENKKLKSDIETYRKRSDITEKSNKILITKMNDVVNHPRIVFDCDVDDKKCSTCSTDYLLGKKFHIKESLCQDRCINDVDCHYYFYNYNQNCYIYSLCEKLRTPNTSGKTVEIIK